MPATVYTAMSGGVDSSAAALLLQQEGYDVVGVTLDLLPESIGVQSPSAAARLAADALGIKHITLDRRAEFEREVISRFVNAYLEGKTPNPCIECNKHIKFDMILSGMPEGGMVATGHYVVKFYDSGSGRWLIKKSANIQKDQSYMLYGLKQTQLESALFPIGDLSKDDVRKIALDAKLPCAASKDSQDICFIPDGDYLAFIERYTGKASVPGDFVDLDGNILGRHRGAAGYTIGQRKGLGISSTAPLYVLNKDCRANTVTLGDEAKLFATRVEICDINLIALESLKSDITVQAKLRYSQKTAEARLIPISETSAVLEFEVPQRAPAPGQAAVFYDGDILVGGGTIV